MDSMVSYLPKVDDKSLELHVTINDAQFNHEGQYSLRLSIHSLHTSDYSNIQIRAGEKGAFTYKNQGETEVVKQLESSKLVRFKEKHFAFRLPPGFCVNDKNHDVYLLVEALSVKATKTKKVGEGKFAIYPRPNAPKMKINVQPGEFYYNYTTVLSLLRTASTESSQMHCGRMRCAFALREHVTSKPPSVSETPEPEPRPKKYEAPPTPKPPPSPSIVSRDNFVPASPPLPPTYEGKTIPEEPVPDREKRTYKVGSWYRHVAHEGKEQIDVIFHGSSSLPATPDGNTPTAFAVVKSKLEDKENADTGATTHKTRQATYSPSWEEMVFINLDGKKAPNDVITMAVGDAPSKAKLVSYDIPVHQLEPFHQYHLELVKPVQGIPNGVRTYVSVTRKLPELPSDPACPNYYGLEVTLRSLERHLMRPLGPLVAVARIVPDYYNYKSDNLSAHPKTAGVSMLSVSYPSPLPATFSVPPRSTHGYPQISLLGRPDNKPSWDHAFLFCDEKDKATMFTTTAALVIEYYVASQTMNEEFWKMKSPVGFSSILLDEDMYKELSLPRNNLGVRIKHLPIQVPFFKNDEKKDTSRKDKKDESTDIKPDDDIDLSTVDGKYPTVEVILRLITDKKPESMVSVSNVEDLPKLDMFPQPESYYRVGTTDIMAIGDKSKDKLDVPGGGELDDISLNATPLPGQDSSVPYEATYYIQKKTKKPGSPIKDGEMPPYEAMETVLPDYQYIFVDPDSRKPNTPHGRVVGKAPSNIPGSGTSQYPPGKTSSYPGGRDGGPSAYPGGPRRGLEDLDKTSLSVLDHQMKELENYRAAVQKMGQDILALRQQIRDLESNNSVLRRDLANYNDASKLMIESAELDGLTKPEIMSKYAALKQTLANQTQEIKNYKDKVQRLQNELIKKNDEEKRYIYLTQHHKKQAEMLQAMQDRMAKLKKTEETLRQQERVIEKMELIIEKQNKDMGKHRKDARAMEQFDLIRKGEDSKANNDALEALTDENRKLRSEVEDLREQLKTTGKLSDDQEKLELYQALEKAEARVTSLEKQLTDNSKEWGKERADLNIRLNEAEHGFGRSQGMVLHDYPIYVKKSESLLLKKTEEDISMLTCTIQNLAECHIFHLDFNFILEYFC
ncbi:hypothetical protein KUTeg_003874 [Tegillarca granosa]|uniref:C2 domain-containing protein n=1 Tax=Tegillarca granosa TaxID=220873 RepID=A0ABQ9FNC7_TEGGR|nr:hypothetical protein KUTeg_003874 [Tegillarca granosa]